MTSNTVEVVLQHNSMQFSDHPDAHKHDAKAVFDIAVDTGAWFVTGTESGAAGDNHDLRDFLIQQARLHKFHGYFNKYGEWVAANSRFLRGFQSGFDGPYIPGTHGLTAPQGAHSPRGTAWLSAYAHDYDLGLMTQGAGHWLTKNSMKASKTDNKPMVDGVADWAEHHGAGRKLVFYNADTNERDNERDVFQGKPLTSISDELGKHPATHGLTTSRGTAIDIISTYDPDMRVSAKSYEVWDDRKHQLSTDHFILHGVLKVRELVHSNAAH